MTGSLYIWFMGAVFLLVMGGVLVLGAMMWIGHWAEKKETGVKHGFLELPAHLQSTSLPTSPASSPPPSPAEPAPESPRDKS